MGILLHSCHMVWVGISTSKLHVFTPFIPCVDIPMAHGPWPPFRRLPCPKRMDTYCANTLLYLYIYIYPQSFHFLIFEGHHIISLHCTTWGRGWMTKASGVGERRKGRGELRRDCHHRVAALFVPTRMQQWYIDIWYITMIYMGEGAGGGPFRGKNHVMSLGSPGIRAKARRL